MAVGGQATSTLRTHALNRTPRQNDIDTTYKRFRVNFVCADRRRRPSAAQWHNAIGKLNPARRRKAGHCHRPTGQTSNCHQAIHSVWWPHSDLSHRRAIPYPTGKRHSGVDAALQPDLLRDRGAALPAGPSLAQHPPAGNANGLHRNTISKVYRQLEIDGVVEAMAGSGIYVRDQQKPRKSRRQRASAIEA